MRVEYLLPAVALSIAAAGCGSDSGNVMATNANPVEPAVIDAALGPELGNELPETNQAAANETTEQEAETAE